MNLHMGHSTIANEIKCVSVDESSIIVDIIESISESITTTSDAGSSTDAIDDDVLCEKLVDQFEEPDHSQLSENLIIFDYDDTLFPTTYLAQRGYRLDGPGVSDDVRQLLDEYSAVVRQTLTLARKLGNVVILTNAETGWIELTSQKFTPGLSQLFESFPLVSARSIYEPLGISSPFQWKLRAFESVIHEHLAKMSPSHPSYNIVSFGDSIHERDAAHQVCNKLTRTVCKSIKFMERPDIGQLAKQHSLISECFDQIVYHQGTLDLCIQCQPPCPEVPRQ
jgi:hypothetical protein